VQRIVISLPDELARQLAHEAQRRRVSVSEVACAALREHLGIHPSEPKTLGLVGIGRSGRRDTARDAEDILAREWWPADDR
jgi:metal-responsive CopG/Arc/MetJ family transcriptional regulator